jgi:hypothetical protein
LKELGGLLRQWETPGPIAAADWVDWDVGGQEVQVAQQQKVAEAE